jgi:DNA-binding MarR family transcriptional regulator
MSESRRSSANQEANLTLEDHLCFALHTATRRVVKTYQKALLKLDLTYPQYLVMVAVWQWERETHNHPTVLELGDRLDLDSGTLTPLLRRLESKGLIVRDRPTGRELYVSATAEGRALKAAASRVPEELLAQTDLSAKKIAALREQLQELRASLPWPGWVPASD